MDQATLAGRRLLFEVGDELREARLRAGLRQADVARILGTSHTRISYVETGQLETFPVLDLARHAAVVGLRLHARLFPAGAPLRDQAQVALLERFRRRLAPSWQIRLEAPLPIPGDQRARDMLLRHGDVTVGVEAITRLRDMQAQVRAAQLKQREGGATLLVLLVAATHANRRALAAAQGLISAEYQVGTRGGMMALAAGRDPGGDALVLL